MSTQDEKDRQAIGAEAEPGFETELYPDGWPLDTRALYPLALGRYGKEYLHQAGRLCMRNGKRILKSDTCFCYYCGYRFEPRVGAPNRWPDPGVPADTACAGMQKIPVGSTTNRHKRECLRMRPGYGHKDFRADTYIDPAFGVFVNEDLTDVAIRFDGEAASKIPERSWHSDQTVEELESGSIIVRFRTNQQSQLLFWVSQWGPNAEILEPPELRARASRWFRETAARYRDD